MCERPSFQESEQEEINKKVNTLIPIFVISALLFVGFVTILTGMILYGWVADVDVVDITRQWTLLILPIMIILIISTIHLWMSIRKMEGNAGRIPPNANNEAFDPEDIVERLAIED